MTEKKTRAKKAKPDVVPAKGTEIVVPKTAETVAWAQPEDLNDWETADTGSMPAKGPDYHITDAGEILLDSGGPIPEDHHVHPAHRLLALARKDARGKS